MDVFIEPSVLHGSVKAISSKSYAHRLLICSALSDKDTFMACSESSEDIEATINCLNSLGAEIKKSPGGYEVKPLNTKSLNKGALLDCGESGSTYRFMLPVACALGAEASFKLSGRLPTRPISELTAELEAHGCRISGIGTSIVKTSGKLLSGVYCLPGNVSSQYISGLLFAFPLLCRGGIIELKSLLESSDYISMTLSALKGFGINVKVDGKSFSVDGTSKYTSPANVKVEGDWSNAAFWLCAGAIGKESIECRELNQDSLQGDRAVAEILSKFGAVLEISDDTYSVKPQLLRALEIDAGNTPDLVPILAVVASISNGKTVFKNAARLRIKESDRLKSVSETLRLLGAEISETEDGLVVLGKKKLHGGCTVDSFGDHRIAMMAAIASTVCEKPVTIKNAEAVNKSYPGFFADFESLGGKVTKGGI